MTVYRYYLPELPDRREDSWSVVLVDQEMGILSIVSDWGNFIYAWGPRGRVHADIRQELLRFGDNYIQDKLADHQNMKFDAEQTIQLVRECVLSRRQSGLMSRDEARADWDDVGRVESVVEWGQFIDSSQRRCDLYHMDGQYEPGNIGGLRQWITKSLPRLRAAIKEELALELKAKAWLSAGG